jgi:hypothetical protein
VPAEGGDVTAVDVPGWKLLERVFWAPDDTFIVNAEPEDVDASSRHQLVRIARDGTTIARLTNDLNDYHGPSVSGDGRTVAALPAVGHVAPVSVRRDRPARLRVVSRGREGISGLAFLEDGRLLAADHLSNGWTLREDGTDVKPLSLERRVTHNVRPCGPGRVVFERVGSRTASVIVGDLFAATAREVGELAAAQRAPAAARAERAHRGGLARRHAGRFPCAFAERRNAEHRVRRGWLRRPGNLERRPAPFSLAAVGTGDCRGDERRGVDNLWELPLDGGPRRQLTQFTEDSIFRFDISRDGRYVLARGRVLWDVVLVQLP